VTASLPQELQSVFQRFITTEYTTVDAGGQPITWPVTPYYTPGSTSIDVTTGLGYPKKANDARVNPLVALLFSDPTGSGLSDPPMVLVQGTATVNDSDLEANRQRYVREAAIKLPAAAKLQPPEPLQKYLSWYYTRLYVEIRPERGYMWAAGDLQREPEIYGAHMEEVRSGHSEEPDRFHAEPEGGAGTWNPRIEELGGKYPHAVLSFVCPDGFPFAARVPVKADASARRVDILELPASVPVSPGLACLTAHEHNPDFTWQSNFQIRGDLTATGSGWALVPHRIVGGFELPKSRLAMLRANAAKARRFRRIAKRELAKRR
jgi:hypothetical protein